MSDGVRVSAPCRLHFGMFSFGRDDRPQFGGVGAMVSQPRVELTITPSERFTVTGDLAQRAEQVAEVALERWQIAGRPSCKINIRAPRDHIGLGVGTQLALAVATGLRRFLKLAEMPLEELAVSVGRGNRSAIGTYGFQLGGLIVDGGRTTGAATNRLAERVELPQEWRFVLVCPREGAGLSGDTESNAFNQLPPVPDSVSDELTRIVRDEMLPAASRRDCDAFGDAVYQFGRLAGECFSAVQGGPYASPQIERNVEAIRSTGVRGVGQTSWGPTVFAIVPDESRAAELVEAVQRQSAWADYQFTIARPDNRGAIVE